MPSNARFECFLGYISVNQYLIENKNILEKSILLWVSNCWQVVALLAHILLQTTIISAFCHFSIFLGQYLELVFLTGCRPGPGIILKSTFLVKFSPNNTNLRPTFVLQLGITIECCKLIGPRIVRAASNGGDHSLDNTRFIAPVDFLGRKILYEFNLNERLAT